MSKRRFRGKGVTREEIRRVPCPTCSVGPGELCKFFGKGSESSHQARQFLAQDFRSGVNPRRHPQGQEQVYRQFENGKQARTVQRTQFRDPVFSDWVAALINSNAQN